MIRHTFVLVLDRSHRTCTYLLSVRCATCMSVALFCIEITLCRWLQQQIMSIRTVGVFAYPHFAPSYIFPISKIQNSVNISIYTDGYAYIFCSFRSFVVSKFRWKIKCKMKLTTKIDWHDPRRFCYFFFFLSFFVTAQYYRHKRLLPSIQYLSVCLCLSVVPSIENREWGRRIIVVTEENQDLKGIGLQEMDRVVDPFDQQPTRPSVITLLWYICFSFKLKTKQKTVQITSRSRKINLWSLQFLHNLSPLIITHIDLTTSYPKL